MYPVESLLEEDRRLADDVRRRADRAADANRYSIAVEGS